MKDQKLRVSVIFLFIYFSCHGIQCTRQQYDNSLPSGPSKLARLTKFFGRRRLFQNSKEDKKKIGPRHKQPSIETLKVMTAADGDATTTVFLEATRNGRHPIGIITSTLDKFINAGTTTEYMTQHVGTYLDDKYAKVESTSTREYYRVISPTKASLEIGESASLATKPTGLVASSVSYDVHGRQTTEYTVKQFRTYIDGHYAHLVSSVSKVYSDPPIISATPVYDPLGRLSSARIQPVKPIKEGTIPTSTIGSKYSEKHERLLKLDDLFDDLEDVEDEENNAIRVRSINDVKPSPVEEEKALPTFTVKSDGQLNFPTPKPKPEPRNIDIENEIDPSSAHRFEPHAKKTALDSVTYIGFVDFTTTIDDTVVIFRPKKTFSTATRNIFIPKIEPTQTLSLNKNLFKPSLASSNDDKDDQVEQPRRSDPTPSIVNRPVDELFKHTSGINPLKSLLAASASRRNRLSKSSASEIASTSSSASIEPSAPSGFGGRPRITLLQRPGRPSLPSSPDIESSSNKAVPEPNEIASSIDPDSDVELVYKTLYTTYTYFTTFFRASTTRVKSREEVISNIITLTNILGPSDLAKLKSSCEVDRTCQFISSTAAPSEFTDGFIGRPNSKVSAGPAFIDEEPRNKVEDNGVFKTFFTTYTYFTTLFVDGSSSISTRTEVYSNVQSSGVPVAPTQAPSIALTSSSVEPQSSNRNSRRLEYSSIARGASNEVTTEDNLEVITDEPLEESNDLDLGDIQLADAENQIDASSVEPSSVKTFYTTFTYFTTLFRNGTSFVTSNLETVTNTADATASPTLVQPSVTFYTTFTYWTTSIDGDNTIITSREETKTDILPAATLTDEILPTSIGIGIDATESPDSGLKSNLFESFELPIFKVNEDLTTSSVPELESGEVDTTTSLPAGSSGITVTPSLKSSDVIQSSSVVDLNELDDDFILASSAVDDDETPISISVDEDEEEEEDEEINASSRSRLTFTRPSSTFTPVIRPNLFRTRVRPNARPRSRAQTTVAIITRSDVTPTLIATPVSSLLQTSSPAFASRVRNLNSASLFARSRSSVVSSGLPISASSINPSRASSSAILSSSVINLEPEEELLEEEISEEEEEANDENVPSIISGLRLRRPDPFKARLKERQRQRLQQLRLANIGQSPGGNSPIFISSRTENIRRRPSSTTDSSKEEDSEEEENTRSSSGSKIKLPPAIASQRERARERINALFRRRQPSFLRPQPALLNEDQDDPLQVEASTRRRKRQVSSYGGGYGSRTRARQSYIRKHRSSNAEPQSYSYQSPSSYTSYKNAYTNAYSSDSPSSTSYDPYYDDSFYYSSTSSASKKQQSKSTSNYDTRTRQVRQPQSPVSETTTRSRSRFNPSRQRLRSTSSSSSSSSTTTTSRPGFRFRPRTVSNTRGGSTSNRFTSSGRRPSSSLFDYDDYDYDYDIDLDSSQNSIPDAITVTHTVSVMTKIPVFENGRNAFRDILTTSPSLEVIAVTALKSTNIDGSPVIYANVRTDTPGLGTQVLTFEALRATETTAVEMTPTRIRGLRTSFSHVVPSTIYNIRPVTTSVVTPLDQNALLSSLLLQLLGGQAPQAAQPSFSTPAALNGLLGGLGAAAPVAPAPTPATRFVTHTNTYVTTLTNVESTVLPITLRGREIKTTLVESKTEVVTATELSTETILAPSSVAPGAFVLPTQQPAAAALPADLQQQLLLAQLQQQLLNQQLLSQVNLDQEGAENVEQTQIPDAIEAKPSTSIVTIFVSGSKPGDFTKITSTVTLTDDESEGRYKRDVLVKPSPVLPIDRTAAPYLDPSLN